MLMPLINLRLRAAKFLVLTCVLFPNAIARAEEAAPKPGEPAPPLKLDQLWNAPKGFGTSWDSLRGQIVVLDFWATWCGPCVQGIPDLNALARQCRNLPVRFIAVTDEKPEVARAFLLKYPLETLVGIDTNGATFKAYGVEARPHCVVIDTKGRIAAVTRPHALTREFIQAVLDGQADRLYEPLARVDLRRHVGVSRANSMQTIGGGVKVQNLPLAALIRFAAPACEGRLDVRAPLPPDVFDAEVAAPGTNDTAWQGLLRSTIESTFALSLREELREQDVLVLTQVAGKTPRLGAATAEDRSTSSPTNFLATSASMANLASHLSVRLPQPVIDETGLTNRFRIELLWDRSKPESIIRAVQDQLDLELKPARRKLVYLVVANAAPWSP